MTIELSEPARPGAAAQEPSRQELIAGFRLVRDATERLCEPLETEDYVAQSMPDASPAKWHLGHTGWFFETFLLKPEHDGRGVGPGEYAFLFNSYYNALGERIERGSRGLLTRPTVAEVYNYRARVDEAMVALLEAADGEALRRLAPLVVLGLHHEQQHQELILTDLKHLFGSNPVRPSYREWVAGPSSAVAPLRWVDFDGGLVEVGHAGGGFAFDNESPRHRVYLEPYALAGRPATNGEFLAFVDAGGYDRPEFWLADGWNARQSHGWSAPLYWRKGADGWRVMSLAGEHPLVGGEPVCHVSYYEADAFARWSGARLPLESEWERAAADVPVLGNFLESELYHPRPLAPGHGSAPPGPAAAPRQLFGDVWEWTSSPYSPYPGYRPAAGGAGGV